ncbi:MAG: hypothetical protein V4666_08810 [Bacteroidota bacterium]
MSKSNQIKVISIFLIVLNVVFFFVPLDEHWDEVKEEYYPNYIYEYSEYLVVHLIFLFCLILNYLNKSTIVYNVTSFVLVIIALLYWIYAIMHRTTMSWTVLGSPYLVTFLPLILYRFYLIKKLKQ